MNSCRSRWTAFQVRWMEVRGWGYVWENGRHCSKLKLCFPNQRYGESCGQGQRWIFQGNGYSKTKQEVKEVIN